MFAVFAEERAHQSHPYSTLACVAAVSSSSIKNGLLFRNSCMKETD